MLTTAKSIQLLDASGMNISPITDITSLYYEVANPNNQRIISRKYIYDEFPVSVDINPNTEVSIGTSTGTGSRHPSGNPLYDGRQLYKIVDINENHVKTDILVSNVSTYIMKGTTLREIKVKNYNLSEILSYYTPLDLMDASCQALNTDINNINSNIIDVSGRIHTLRESLDAISRSLTQIINWGNDNKLVPNKFYLINNYYVSAGSDGCMALPNNNNNNFSGPTSGSSLSLLVKASDASNLDGKLYEMYDKNGNALKVYGTYKIEDGKVRITYMKDQYGNEAPYDFYNLKYNDYYTYTYNNSNALLNNSNNIKIKNNIIKTNPFDSSKMIIINENSVDETLKIINNYFGFNNDINIKCSCIYIKNNKIKNNNIITTQQITDEITIYNSIIENNNNIIIYGDGDGIINYNNIIIINYNNINFYNYQIKNLTINLSNNITLNNDAFNVTILNNCNASINLSDNIIVDNYINIATNSSLTTTPNSVYLFGQNIYAKSFNTLK